MKFLFAKLLYNAYELQIKLSVLKRRFCLGNRPINLNLFIGQFLLCVCLSYRSNFVRMFGDD